MVARSDSRSLHIFADVCDYHVKLEEIDDSVVLHSIKPKVQPHAVIFDDSQGRPEIRPILTLLDAAAQELAHRFNDIGYPI